jgi:hypothetical protein
MREGDLGCDLRGNLGCDFFGWGELLTRDARGDAQGDARGMPGGDARVKPGGC